MAWLLSLIGHNNRLVPSDDIYFSIREQRHHFSLFFSGGLEEQRTGGGGCGCVPIPRGLSKMARASSVGRLGGWMHRGDWTAISASLVRPAVSSLLLVPGGCPALCRAREVAPPHRRSAAEARTTKRPEERNRTADTSAAPARRERKATHVSTLCPSTRASACPLDFARRWRAVGGADVEGWRDGGCRGAGPSSISMPENSHLAGFSHHVCWISFGTQTDVSARGRGRSEQPG